MRRVLTAAGWYAGRDVSDRVATWLRQLPGSLPVHPVARALLDEFGGLAFRQLRRIGSASGGFDVRFWPLRGRVLVDLFAEFAADLGVPVFPLAWYEDGESDIACAADGRVFLLHEAGEFLVGPTPEQAIVRLVRGEPFTLVDDHGNPV
ncbi:SUKH-3 domain-containing protein [Rhizomonospora bruguierae]|uniref:SUKH-3 domain-containing protein n=1 Tax=Rhizomonospora bruguierae TaxID=1581705 RepID=UPI001BCCF4D3|nr:SUKH-3 domain-containing protein [Micromonospora sp. NBRC 107566]